ncbi:MAG TPA: hypothetical protein VGQ24_05265 [Gemmatimonadales bacterium]|jgi:hypothetical protein|nr:hypothetical protein [Gemmatimonadales bacterium]
MNPSRDPGAFARSVPERGFLATLHIALSTLWSALLDNLDEWGSRTNTSGNTFIALRAIQSENKAHRSPDSTPSRFRIIRNAFRAVGGIRSHCSARTRRVGRRTMEVRLRDDPPALVILDGFTAITRLRHRGALGGLLAYRSTRELAISGARFPTPVEAVRRRDLRVPAVPRAAITP